MKELTKEGLEIAKDIRRTYGVWAILFLLLGAFFGYYIFQEKEALEKKVIKMEEEISQIRSEIIKAQLAFSDCERKQLELQKKLEEKEVIIYELRNTKHKKR